MAEPRRERKVVTVLFADLVGFTARAESLDPEDVDAVLRPYHERLRAELERWGGTVEKFIGDAVVAVFGAPTAREDDPERAVRAALAIRDWATDERDVEVRIAVNTGEALVSLDARADAGEGVVTGDVVNTASRMQSAAPVNGILVGEQTYRRTRDVIDHREAPPVDAKGKSEPVRVWEAVQARSRFGVDVRQHGAAPLVGRAHELDALTSTLRRVRDEREPQLVTVVGVPGIGKSRLLWELFEWIGRGGELTYWRQGRSLPYGEGVSLWALAEMVKAHAGILEGDDPSIVAEKLEQAVDEAGVEDAPWVAARLGPLVGIDADAAAVSRDEAFTAWRQFWESLAERHALVLVFEDIHWADDVLLDFVEHLADWARSVPILVLCSARPELLERRPGWGGGKRNSITLALPPLTEDDSARLLSLILEQAVLPAETQRALLDRASGNPLYAEQFARLYRERGSVDDLPLPDSVHGLIAARLDALPPEEKALLHDAAVMGKVFWSGPLGGDTVVERMHALERKEFVRRERRSSVTGEHEYAFRHVLVRDVAYGQIPRAERAAKHLRAASWIASLGRPQDHAELLAGHYLAVIELDRDGSVVVGVRDSAVDAFGAAAERAAALNSFANAAAYARAGLALAAQDSPARARLLLQLGKAEAFAAGGGQDALLAAAEAFERAGEAELAAESRVYVALGGYEVGREDQLEEQLERATSLVASRPASRAKAVVWGARAREAYLRGRPEQARELAEEALTLAEQVGADEIRSEALLYLGGAKVDLGDPSGIDEIRESVDVAKSINSAVMISRSLNNLGIALRFQGRWEDFVAASDEALAAAERFGMEGTLLFARGAVPWRDYERGRWDEALAAAEAYLGEPGSKHIGNEGSARLGRALVSLGRDDPETALAETARAVEAARATMAALPMRPAYGLRAYVLAELGRVDEARELWLELLELGREGPIPFAGDSRAPWTWERCGVVDDVLGAMSGPATPWLDAAVTAVTVGWGQAVPSYVRMGPPTSAAFAQLQSPFDADVRAALEFYRSAGAPFYERQAEARLAAIA